MLAFASRYGKLFVYEFRLINSTCDMTWNSIGYTELNKVNEWSNERQSANCKRQDIKKKAIVYGHKNLTAK